MGWYVCLTLGHAGIVQRHTVLAHIRDSVFEQREHFGHDVDAQTVTGAEILIDPNSKLGRTYAICGGCYARAAGI